MIASFADRTTEALFHGATGGSIKRIPPQIIRIAIRKLDMLNSARLLSDLLVPPGNCLESLRGNLRAHHSIRGNNRWRIVFRWEGGDAHAVRIVDYHK